MSTPTQSNTLPAIRALLWERWRVMRGSFLLFWAGYAALLVMRMSELDQGRAAPLELSDWHLFVFSFLLPFAIASMYMSEPGGRHGGSKFGLGLGPHFKVLPAQSAVVAFARLGGATVGGFVLVLGTLAVDWIVAGKYAFVLNGPVSVLFLLVIALSVLLNLWVAVVPWVRVALAAFVFVPLMTVVIVTRGMEVPAIPTALACIAIGLPMAGIAHRAGRSGWVSDRFQPFARFGDIRVAALLPTPALRRPTAMLVWYEWRSWGWIFVGVFTAIGAVHSIHVHRAGGLAEDIGIHMPYALALLTLLGFFGVVLPLRAHAIGDSHTRAFTLRRPMSTWKLACGQLLGRASVLIAAIVVSKMLHAAAFWLFDRPGFDLDSATIGSRLLASSETFHSRPIGLT